MVILAVVCTLVKPDAISINIGMASSPINAQPIDDGPMSNPSVNLAMPTPSLEKGKICEASILTNLDYNKRIRQVYPIPVCESFRIQEETFAGSALPGNRSGNRPFC